MQLLASLKGKIITRKYNTMLTKQASSAIRKILTRRTAYRSNLQSSTALQHVRLQQQQSIRFFQTESEYHNKADDTLNTIQDTLDFCFEDNPNVGSPDINYASGVLTVALSQGTWVLNKQTPNQQIWWSSPVTGPRRYEFDESGKWIWTRYVDFKGVDPNGKWDDTRFLGEALKKEMADIFHFEDGLEDLDNL
jgi:frataxin